MDIPSLIGTYLQETDYKKWSVINCLEYLSKQYKWITSQYREEIKDECKNQCLLIKNNKLVGKRVRNKAESLFKNIEKQFGYKEVIIFFNKMDEKANESIFDTKTDLFGSEVAVSMIDNKFADLRSEIAIPSVLKRKSSCLLENIRKKVAVVDNAKSSSDEKDYEIADENFSDPSTLGGFSDMYSSTSTTKNEQSPMSSAQVLNDPVMTGQQTFPCILKSGKDFTDTWNEYLDRINLHPWSVEYDCMVKTFHNDLLKSLCSKADWKQIRGNQLHLAEEGLLERLKPVLQKSKNDKQSLLQKFAQVWISIGKGDITLFEQYALLVIHIFINEFMSKRNVISHPSTTEAMWSTLMSFITGKAIRDGDMEYTWGEIVLDSTALRKDGGRDILALPKVSSGHKGDGTGLSNDGRECFVLEISFAPHDQDRRKTAEDFYKLLREMRDMLQASKKEKYELGYVIPKDGLCVYGSQCYGYRQNLYEMEYIKPFYIVRKIGSIKFSHNDITELAFVLRMMWAFRERIISANQVWNSLKSRYEANNLQDSQDSSDDGDDYTKQTPKKKSEWSF